MFCDERTAKEIGLSVCLDLFQPLTPYGREQKDCRPFLPGEEEAWQQCLQEQAEIKKQFDAFSIREPVHALLTEIPDISSVLRKLEEFRLLDLTEWFQLKTFLYSTQKLHSLLKQTTLFRMILKNKAMEKRCEKAFLLLNPAKTHTSSFWFDDAYDDRLREARKTLRKLQAKVKRDQEQKAVRIAEKTGQTCNRFGEWVVPRDTEGDRLLKEEAELMLVRQTSHESVYRLKNEHPLSCEIAAWEEQIARIEQEINWWLVKELVPLVPDFREWMVHITRLDLQWARIRAAEHWQGVRPRWSKNQFRVKGAFHPALEQKLNERGQSMTRVDCSIRRGVTVIIGPNMGGKTVGLKTFGLIAVLAQYGFFVPAAACDMPLFSWVAGLIGDGQGIRQGLSRFGAEMVRFREFLQLPGTGLLLLDETGSGTNPVEGGALARAVTAFLAKERHYSVHVTHYQEVLEVKGIRLYQVAGISGRMAEAGAFLPDALEKRMDYRLIPVKEGRKSIPHEAIRIAEAIGLPPEIIRMAKQQAGEKAGEEQ
jgi:DNA mismatch repair protein MutS2